MGDLSTLRLATLLALPCLAACAPPPGAEVTAVEGFGTTDASMQRPSGSDSDAGGDDAVDTLPAEPLAFGVVASDYVGTSITLLRPDGRVLAPDFMNSGSATAGLVTALSGDVVLPTRSGDPHILTVLDRFRTDVVTRVDPADGTILGQLKTHAPNRQDDAYSFSSNPYDYVQLGPHDAWVTRFEPNVHAAPGDPDRGLDLLHIDPTDFERGQRISLWHLNTEAQRRNPDTGATQAVPVYARPATMVRLGATLVVGISALSLNFDAAGPGLVALVDPAAGTAVGLELPGLQNCDQVRPVPGDDARVVVACSGFFRGDPRETAGLAVVKLAAAALSIEHLWRAAEHPDAALAVSALIALGGTEVAAVASGAFAHTDDAGTGHPATDDAMYIMDIESGQQTPLFEAEDRYVIGSGAFNAERGLLLVPDASTDDKRRPTAGVRLFTRGDDGAFMAGDVIAIDPILPARQVRPL